MTLAHVPIVDEVLVEAEVIRRLPGRDEGVRAWLETHVRRRRGPTGLRVYRWSEVLAALPLEEELQDQVAPPPSTSGRLPRERL